MAVQGSGAPQSLEYEKQDLDFIQSCIDEIALEGLDGITIAGLWTRLERRQNFPLRLDDFSKPFLWNILKRRKEVSCYCLPEPRPPLVVKPRELDPETGIMSDYADGMDIYPVFVINDEEHGVQGSCTAYFSRSEVTSDAQRTTLDEAMKKWGDKLVMVGTQEARNKALTGSHPVVVDLTPIQYVMLERIGRSRHLGETTHGKFGLISVIQENPRTLFYLRKALLKHRLIAKQDFMLKTTSGHCQFGLLLHLPRFFVEFLPKSLYVIRQVTKMLEEAPKNVLPADSALEQLQVPANSMRKIFKMNEFKRLIKIENVPYRTIHPDAKPEEYLTKNRNERSVKVYRLIPKSERKRGEKDNDEEGDEEDDDDGEYGIHDKSRYVLNRHLVDQVFNYILECGPSGASLRQVQTDMGLGKLDARTVVRKLQKRNELFMISVDQGRQRSFKYIAKVYEDASEEARKSAEERRLLVENLRKQALERAQVLQDRVSSCGTSSLGQKNLQEEEDKQISEITSKDTVTLKTLKRTNLILRLVEEKQIVPMIQLERAVIAEEKNEGSKERMARLSLLRLLRRLESQQRIRCLKTTIHYSDRDREIFLVCHPSLPSDPVELQELIQKEEKNIFAGFFRVNADQRVKTEPEVSQEVKEALAAIETQENGDENSPKSAEGPARTSSAARAYGRQYGIVPKFHRARLLHQFCFYLTRGYDGDPDLDQDKAWESIKGEYDIGGNDLELSDLPRLYNPHVGWKMFISPLSDDVYKDVPRGWILLCDIFMRLPVCLAVTSVAVTIKVDGLEEILRHPIKTNIPFLLLPSAIKQKILQGRLFVTRLGEVVNLLVHLGLAQNGPRLMKTYETQYIYINTRASIRDTQTASPAYSRVDDSKSYPLLPFPFNSLEDVEGYWKTLSKVCINTPLGRYSHDDGDAEVPVKVRNKPQLRDALKERSLEKGPSLDIGTIPGDGLGAGGLDSSLYSHIQRSWFSLRKESASAGKEKSVQEKMQLPWGGEQYSEMVANSMIDKSKSQLKATHAKSYARRLSLTSQDKNGKDTFKKGQKRKREDETAYNPEKDLQNCDLIKEETVVSQETTDGSKEQHQETADDDMEQPPKKAAKRTVPARIRKRETRKKKTPCALTDQVDKEALILLGKQRAKWGEIEDRWLIAIKVVLSFLSSFVDEAFKSRPFHRVFSDPFVIRDLLHSHCEEARVKTSQAAMRRLKMLSKMGNHDQLIHASKNMMKLDPDIIARFTPAQHFVNLQEAREHVKGHAEELVRLMKDRIYPPHDVCTFTPKLPPSLEEVNESFVVSNVPLSSTQSLIHDVNNKVDIHLHNVCSVVLSSLCSRHDKTSFTLQLYYIYNQYPDSLLRSAILCLQRDGIISKSKHFMKSMKHHWRSVYMPLSGCPYVLSRRFQYQYLMPFQYNLFSNSCKILRALEEDLPDQGLDLAAVDDGACPSVMAFLVFCRKVLISTEVPEQFLTLDTDVLKDKGISDVMLGSMREEEDSSLWLKSSPSHISRKALFSIRERDSVILLNGRAFNVYTYMVMNFCHVRCSLTESDPLAPIPKETIEKVLDVQSRYHVKMMEEDEVRCRLEQVELEVERGLWEVTRIIFKKLEAEKELGATAKQFKQSLDGCASDRTMMEALSVLQSAGLVRRVGLKSIRYVGIRWCQPWFTQTPQVKRLVRERFPKMNKGMMSLEELRIAMCLIKKEDSDFVHIHPWIRVDGSLNRRVFDRFLGSVLCQILRYPGCSVEALIQRFAPSLSCSSVYDLVLTLKELNCVRLFTVKVVGDVLAFSEPLHTEIVDWIDEEDMSCVCIEPSMDAIPKMGSFIGDRQYNVNFLADIL